MVGGGVTGHRNVGIKTTPDTVTAAGRFFLEPSQPRQRQYEALRAYFADGAPSAEVARRFGYQPGAFRVLCWRFRHQMDRDFFRASPHGPTSQPRKDAVRTRVIALRKRNFSVYDSRDELDRAGPNRLSVTPIQEVLRAEGFARLPRRADEERLRRPRPLAEAIADVRQFSRAPRVCPTRVGGLFLVLPLLAQLDLDTMVAGCRFPDTKMIPAVLGDNYIGASCCLRKECYQGTRLLP